MTKEKSNKNINAKNAARVSLVQLGEYTKCGTIECQRENIGNGYPSAFSIEYSHIVIILETSSSNQTHEKAIGRIVDTKPRVQILLTCQLTRLERFSTVSRYSVRVGGPYLQKEKHGYYLLCIISIEAGLSWT